MSRKQLDVLFSHFAAGRSITTYEATVQFGICRLSERIRELEAKGWPIHREREDSNGKHYVRYSMLAGELFGVEKAGLGALPGPPLRGPQTSAALVTKTPGGGIPSGRLEACISTRN